MDSNWYSSCTTPSDEAENSDGVMNVEDCFSSLEPHLQISEIMETKKERKEECSIFLNSYILQERQLNTGKEEDELIAQFFAPTPEDPIFTPKPSPRTTTTQPQPSEEKPTSENNNKQAVVQKTEIAETSEATTTSTPSLMVEKTIEKPQEQDDLLNANEDKLSSLIKEKLPNITDRALNIILEGIVFKQRQYNQIYAAFSSNLTTTIVEIVDGFLKANKGWGLSELDEKKSICDYTVEFVNCTCQTAKNHLIMSMENVFSKTIRQIDVLMSFPVLAQNALMAENPIDNPMAHSISMKFRRLPKCATELMENWCLNV